MKDLMQELGNAINESLSDSERIAEAIGRIRTAGYDVFLVLEATIGFNKREDEDDDEEASAAKPAEPRKRRRLETTGRFRFTTQDHKFLRALKISVDEEQR